MKRLLSFSTAVILAVSSGCRSGIDQPQSATPESGIASAQSFGTLAEEVPLYYSSTIYLNWEKNDGRNLAAFMTGGGPIIFNYYSWSISDNADLVIPQTERISYQKSYGPVSVDIRELDWPYYGFSGEIRFNESSHDSGAVTVSTSFQGSTLTISPVWLKYSIPAAAGVNIAYVPVNNSRVSNPDYTPGGTEPEYIGPPLVPITMNHNIPDEVMTPGDYIRSGFGVSGSGFDFWADSEKQNRIESSAYLPDSGLTIYVETAAPANGSISASHACTVVEGWAIIQRMIPPMS